jgi:hypothetical protein
LDTGNDEVSSFEAPGVTKAKHLRNAEGKLALSLFEPRFVVAASMPPLFTA